MTRTIVFFIFITAFLSCSGQIVFRKKTIVNPFATFIDEFVINLDSSCYFNARYLDNSRFDLYKGKIKKINDTLFNFTYQPIVEFGCNRRLFFDTDSVFITINQKDTLFSNLNFKVKTKNSSTINLDLSVKKAVYIKNISQENFIFDTKFINPLTNKKISMTIHPPSEPELDYYGSTTISYSVKLTIKNNILKLSQGRWQDTGALKLVTSTTTANSK